MTLTREQFVEIADELVCDKVSGVKVQQLIDAYDALAADRDAWKRLYAKTHQRRPS